MASAWSVLIIIIAIGGLLFFANMVAKDQLGVSITDALGLTTSGIPSSELSAHSIDTVPEGSDPGISRAMNEKIRIEAEYGSQLRRIQTLNGSSDFRKRMTAAVGNSYSVYIFGIYSNTENATGVTHYYKTFEWVIRTQDGMITQFDNGGTPQEGVTVDMLVDSGTAEDLIGGNLVQTDILEWTKEGKLKMQPGTVSDADKVIKFLNLFGS